MHWDQEGYMNDIPVAVLFCVRLTLWHISWPTSIGCDRHWPALETWPWPFIYRLACLPSTLLLRAVLTKINKELSFTLMYTEHIMMRLCSVSHDRFQCCGRCVIKFLDTDGTLTVSARCKCDVCCECIIFFRPFQVPEPVDVSNVDNLNLGHFFAAYCKGHCHMLTYTTLHLPVDVSEKRESYPQASTNCRLCMCQNEVRLLLFCCRTDCMHFSVETVNQFQVFPFGIFSSWGRP